MAEQPSRAGCIITFYSYKGGTGRTMALANVACLLAETGDSVLAVDWDLEAPGLHRFFPPRLRTSSGGADLGLDDTPGVIDLFGRLRQQLPASPPTSDDEADAAVASAFTGIDLDHYVKDTAVPGVFIMRAGRNDDGGYARRVGTFDWEGVFHRAPAIYREFTERLAARYQWVLVDSRTGVTDISGICTSLLPERLVVVFTPNRQSLTGVRELVQRATEYRRGSEDFRPLLVYPLPSRIEASLQDLRARWRFGDPDHDVIGYQPMFQDLLAKSYGLSHCELSAYFDDVQIQQTPDYAYGEEIAVRRTGDRFSMANSYVVFTNRLRTGEPPWTTIAAPSIAPQVLPTDPITAATPWPPLTRPTAASPPPPSPARTTTAGEVQAGTLQVFLSYAHQDRERVAMIARSLEGRGLRVMDRSVEPGTDWSSVVSQQLDASDAILVFWSRAAVESRTIMAEAEEGLRRGILVPVLLEDVAPPLAFRSVQSADLRRPTADAIEKLADAVERVAAATPGTVIVPTPFVPSAPVPIAPAPAHRPLRLAIAATVALVAVLGVGGWIAFRSFGSSSGDSPAPQAVAMVTVPDFVGAATSDASKTAELIGLTLAMTDGRGGQGTFFDGVVTKQSPAPGASVARLAKVELEVAAQTVTVPTLVGTSLDTALQTLDRNRLQLGKTLSQPVADRKPGTIVRQTPAPGEMVAAGSTVDVFVATVPRPTRRTLTVPNFIGATTSAAEAQASRLGIKLTKTDAHGAPMPGSATGLVVSQSRAPNSQMGANETLQIGVTQRGTVPNLLGLASVDAASSILGALGLRLGNIQYRSAAGIARGAIIAQSPSPGVSVREGSSVMVVVASGK